MQSLKSSGIVGLWIILLASLASADTPQLNVSTSAMFFAQVGTIAPAPQQFTLTVTGAATVAFTAAANVETPAGGGWLSVSPSAGVAPATLTVSVNASGLAPGEYDGNIKIAAAGLTSQDVSVDLKIFPAGTAALVARPGELEFSAVQGGSAPPPQTLEIFNTLNASFSWTVSTAVSSPAGGQWLKLSSLSGSGNSAVQVSVDPAGLTEGEYRGMITVTSGSSSASVAVELTIRSTLPAQLVLSPRAFNFIIESNATVAAAPQMMRIMDAGGGTLSWTAAAMVTTPSGGNWLSISSAAGSTPSNLSIRADAAGLAPGMYAGKITVTSGTSSAEARVFLRVLPPEHPMVLLEPRSLEFSFAAGAVTPSSRTIDIRSRATGLTYTAAAAANGGAWLAVSPSSGNVPGTLTVSVNSGIAATLAAGVYTGNIQVTVAGAAQQVHNVHVALKVFSPVETPRLELEPGGLAFIARAGGPNPPAKMVQLEAEGTTSLGWSTTVSTVSGGNWLSVSPASGTLSAGAQTQISISVKEANLTPGVYSGTVAFTPAGSSGAPPMSLLVALIVTNSTTVNGTGALTADGSPIITVDAVSSPLFAFFSAPGNGFVAEADVPMNVQVTVLDATGAYVVGARVTVSSSNGEPDMALTDEGSGQYSGVFRALASGTLTLSGSAGIETKAASSFAVSGDMQPGAGQSTVIFQNGAVNAASFAQSPTPVAPGSLISVFGLSLASSAGLAANVPLPTSINGVSVTIGGIRAPLVAVASGSSGDQINVQVPVELSDSQTEVVVDHNGVMSVPETITLSSASPAIFTATQSGFGAGAIIHADGSLVNVSSAAAAGELISVYATGLGGVQAPVGSGFAASGADSVIGNVTVTIGGQPAQVQYAGLAPFFVGLYQVNVLVPPGLAAGDQPIVITVDGVSSSSQVTVSVR